ncbi:unnamed protein product [Mytilus edulis]|uniref:Uncharacterized protein n=1 Tax=Mytilus edulis TaxID=6550 RepID=A0A8S3PR67_MYTED|nr:unnamed protein product [Mytilus edulis]
MAKRKAEALNDDEISGYLVEVSPIKTSQQNNKYFDGTINSNRKTFQHFDVSKHSQFRSAGTQKSPVKLQRISQVPSKRDASQNDVLIKRTSSLNVLRSLDFSCKDQPKETSQQCTLEKIQNLPEKSKVIKLAMHDYSSKCSVATVMNKSNSEIVDDMLNVVYWSDDEDVDAYQEMLYQIYHLDDEDLDVVLQMMMNMIEEENDDEGFYEMFESEDERED